jgi:hypothetical protein
VSSARDITLIDVIDLQKFEHLLKQEARSGNVEITEKEIITDKLFEL